jgi:hypothetical protein
MLKIKSLQQRLMVFLLLPVAIFLAAAGGVGYFYIRRSLFQEWQETALLQLGHAAHSMDMRLEAITNWMQLMNRAASTPQAPEVRTWILQQLREQEGVSWAGLTWQGARGGGSPAPHQVAKILPPQFFYLEGQNQVGLRSDLLDLVRKSRIDIDGEYLGSLLDGQPACDPSLTTCCASDDRFLAL